MMKEILQELIELRKAVLELTLEIKKDKADPLWIKEKVACEILGLSPRTLRKRALSNTYPFSVIAYRFDRGNRNWEYNRKGIQKYKELTTVGGI